MTAPAPEAAPALGPYRLIGQIGEGGMGLVYLASAPDGTRVAVKVLRPYVVGDADGRTRLAREVDSLRRVRSPHVAEVYDADPAGPTPYIVTRYVAGPSLRDLVDSRGPLDGPPLLRLARGLAQALAVVHDAGVLHRDVKPSNVLLDDGDPVLIDFGLAQLSDDLHLTRSGWVLGTPGYLAPEVLAGGDATRAGDVHAWGATVTFAASGAGPYGSGPPLAILDRAHRGEPDLDAVPEGLRAVVAAALRVDPVNRPTARQLLDMLGLVTLEPRTRPVPLVARRDDRERDPLASPFVVVPAVSQSPEAEPRGEEPTSLVEQRVLPDRTLLAPTVASTPAPAREATPAVGRFKTAAFWLTLLCLVVCATLAAPLITWVAVVVAQWALRTWHLGERSHVARREARGSRRRDPALAVVLTPWFAARRLPAALASGFCTGLLAAGPVALALLGPAAVETPSLAVAGLAVGLGTWLGPLSEEVRQAGPLVTSRLPRGGLANVVIVLLTLAVSTGLLAVQQAVGVARWPF